MVHIKLNRNESILNGASIEKLKEFRRQQLFTDVILICEDKLHHAHKIVITASANNNTRTKLLFPNLNYSTVLMTGVSPHDVENLLCFLYSGEIWIPHKEVEGFLKAARILQVDRIERNSEIEIPSDLLLQNPENGIQTPLQNIHNPNDSHPLSNRRRAGVGNTRTVVLVSQSDQENVYHDATRSMNVSHVPHNNTQESSRLSTNVLGNSFNMRNATTFLSSQQQRQKTSMLKKKNSSSTSKRPPEKFRAAMHFNDGDELIHSLISPCAENAENKNVTPIVNYNKNSIPSPMDTPVRPVNEDSWNVFQLTEAGNSEAYDDSIENEESMKIREKSSENARPPHAPKSASSFYSSKISHPKTSTPTSKDETLRSLFCSPSFQPTQNEDDPSAVKVDSKNSHHYASNNSVTPTCSKTDKKEIKTLVTSNPQRPKSKRKKINEQFSKKQDTNERFLRSRNKIQNTKTNDDVDDINDVNSKKCPVTPSTPFHCCTARTTEDHIKRDVMSSGREIRIFLQDFRKQSDRLIQNIVQSKIATTKGEAEPKQRSGVKRPKPKNLNNKKKKISDNINESRDQALEINSSSSRKSESVDKRKVLRSRKPRGCPSNNNDDGGQINQPITKRARTTTAQGMKNKQAENPNIQERLRKRVKKVAI